jgi:hypothetical protein
MFSRGLVQAFWIIPALMLFVGCVPSDGRHSPIPIKFVLIFGFLLKYWPILLAIVLVFLFLIAKSFVSLVKYSVPRSLDTDHPKHCEEDSNRKIDSKRHRYSNNGNDRVLTIGRICKILIGIILVILCFVIPLLNSFRN